MNSSSQKQPVIIQVIPELSAGGAEQGCIDIAAELVRSGATSIVVSHGGNRVHELARAGAEHVNMPMHSKNPVVMWNNIRRLKNLITKHKADIVHARSRAPAWSAYKACLATKTHFVTTCHAPYNIENEPKRFYNSSIAKGDRVIAISHYVADYMRHNYKIDPQKIRVIHRGIAIEKFHPTAVTPDRVINLSKEWRIPDDASIVMMPGRLTRWKGQLVLIDAMARLPNKDVFCVIIGDHQGRKEYLEELETAIREKNLEGRVRIIPHCNDMPAAYMLAAVVVSASTDPEGFGRIPVEAQAMGRPIIATDHGGAQETILRGETGWLIPPNDSKILSESIAEALTLNPTQRAILATRAMSHIAQYFTRDVMADQTLNVYAELLQSSYASFSQQSEPLSRAAE